MNITNWATGLICLLFMNACSEQTIIEGEASFEKLISCESALNIIKQNTNGYKIIDIRKHEDYQQKHIPGAIHTWRPDYEDLQSEVKGIKATKERERRNLIGLKHAILDEVCVISYFNRLPLIYLV